jgi:hypothetical protein
MALSDLGIIRNDPPVQKMAILIAAPTGAIAVISLVRVERSETLIFLFFFS